MPVQDLLMILAHTCSRELAEPITSMVLAHAQRWRETQLEPFNTPSGAFAACYFQARYLYPFKSEKATTPPNTLPLSRELAQVSKSLCLVERRVSVSAMISRPPTTWAEEPEWSDMRWLIIGLGNPRSPKRPQENGAPGRKTLAVQWYWEIEIALRHCEYRWDAVISEIRSSLREQASSGYMEGLHPRGTNIS